MGNTLSLISTCLPSGNQERFQKEEEQILKQDQTEKSKNKEENWSKMDDSFGEDEQTEEKNLTTNTNNNNNNGNNNNTLQKESLSVIKGTENTNIPASPSLNEKQQHSAPPSSPSINNSTTPMKEDFFSDMEPVYKAPKKIEVEKPITPKNSRLKVQEESSETPVGWEEEEMNI